MSKAFDEDNQDWADLRTDLSRSVRYHSARVKHYDGLDSWAKLMELAFGSGGAFMGLIGKDPIVAGWLGASVFMVAASTLIFRTSQKARLHGDLGRRYIQLLRDLEIESTTVDQEKWRRFRARRLEIEAEEPPVLQVLDSICHNQEARAQGSDHGQFVKVSAIQSTFANWIDLWPSHCRRYDEL